MENSELRYDDFFVSVNDDYKDFVNTVKERVFEEGYTIIKMGSSKTNLYTVAFIQPKTRRGIANFYLRKRSFKMTISAKNCAKYPDVFSSLPEKMVVQIGKANPCLNLTDPGKCMDKCAGYEFNIGETLYQKCRFGCFQFDVNAENIPFLMDILETELKERAVNG